VIERRKSLKDTTQSHEIGLVVEEKADVPGHGQDLMIAFQLCVQLLPAASATGSYPDKTGHAFDQTEGSILEKMPVLEATPWLVLSDEWPPSGRVIG
jgi:hypothetical protein